MDALKKLASPFAYVFRDRHIQKIDSTNFVPCDLISLETGNIIPADVRFLKTISLVVDLFMLKGETCLLFHCSPFIYFG